MKKLMKEHPLVSVIVPTKNSEATIERCLKSIVEQNYKNIEIIVVDNYSSDRTRQIARKYGAKVYLKGPERAAQINFGVRKARGEYVYRVDSDFVLNRNIIREAVEICETKGYDAVIIHNTSDPTISFWSRVRKAERDCYRNDEFNVAARFWRRKAFLSVGGFDENLVAGDDYDLHNRLLEAGFRIGRIESEEIHIGEPRTLAEIVWKHYYYGKSIGRFIRKNPKRAMIQLSPFRMSYTKCLSNFLNSPLLMLGFTIYQIVRYIAAAIGIVTRRF